MCIYMYIGQPQIPLLILTAHLFSKHSVKGNFKPSQIPLLFKQHIYSRSTASALLLTCPFIRVRCAHSKRTSSIAFGITCGHTRTDETSRVRTAINGSAQRRRLIVMYSRWVRRVGCGVRGGDGEVPISVLREMVMHQENAKESCTKGG